MSETPHCRKKAPMKSLAGRMALRTRITVAFVLLILILLLTWVQARIGRRYEWL